MKLSLPPEIEKAIDERVKAGRYATREDVIAAALATLAQHESAGDFEAGELDQLLAEGDKDIELGDVADGKLAFDELRRRSEQRRSTRK